MPVTMGGVFRAGIGSVVADAPIVFSDPIAGVQCCVAEDFGEKRPKHRPPQQLLLILSTTIQVAALFAVPRAVFVRR